MIMINDVEETLSMRAWKEQWLKGIKIKNKVRSSSISLVGIFYWFNYFILI